MNNTEPKHECEHFLLTDLAVYECECGSLETHYMGNVCSYIPESSFTALSQEVAELRKENEHLQSSLDAELKSWENVVNYVNDGSGYEDEGNWIPDIVLNRLKLYDKLSALSGTKETE